MERTSVFLPGCFFGVKALNVFDKLAFSVEDQLAFHIHYDSIRQMVMKQRIGRGYDNGNNLHQYQSQKNEGAQNTDCTPEYHHDNQNGDHGFNGKLAQQGAYKQGNPIDPDAAGTHQTNAEDFFSQCPAVFEKHGNGKFQDQITQQDAGTGDENSEPYDHVKIVNGIGICGNGMVGLIVQIQLILAHVAVFFQCEIKGNAVQSFVFFIAAIHSSVVAVKSQNSG